MKKLNPHQIGTLAALIEKSIVLFPNEDASNLEPQVGELSDGSKSKWEQWLDEAMKLNSLPSLDDIDGCPNSNALFESILDYYTQD